MSETAEFVYKCTDYYAPQYEESLKWDDPTINIDWPLVNGEQPNLSEKDLDGLHIQDAAVFKSVS
jgi:dTDP-4-dehydrorhamnose 3,5-epimerase